ncbi:MAG TPA: hypothetical protein VK851_02705, partial [Anaerolineales bacterium]|nr:hypothetical protein [Anaerolineales bacterium]
MRKHLIVHRRIAGQQRCAKCHSPPLSPPEPAPAFWELPPARSRQTSLLVGLLVIFLQKLFQNSIEVSRVILIGIVSRVW